ncbi:MAG: hypothetical protein HY912_03735 [Desulfomonile tiedjei]|uniref:Uncharacterized protein n=1 Tax=Desulfomonile tiedjei TaxID=2358 RepID=A0A9D6UZJ9_9BACT|nr:hypothetical protein [Desulfomonile tiedjei]
MSPNKFKPHILVLPEDDANRQIANGFMLHPQLNGRFIQVLRPVGGWARVLDYFTEDLSFSVRQFDQRRIVMLIDFDQQHEKRFNYVRSRIPQELDDRVFVLGVLSKPEELRRVSNRTYEEIGWALSQDCVEDTRIMWGHELLSHNETVLQRMISSVKPFLFNLSMAVS